MEEDKKVIAHYFGYSNYKTFAEDEQIKKSMGTLSKSIVNIINELERLQKEFEAVDHECSRLEKKEIELEKENRKYRLEIIPKLDGEIQVYKQRIDELLSDTCLHCNENTPLYCEKCYQKIITKNAELQLEIEELKQDNSKQWKERCKLFFEVDDSIPKQKVRDKIEELKAKYNLGDDYWQYDYDVDMNTIDILEELSRE